ncbi:MAG: transporter substrate-binding domain-containing protein [Alphaproteobacteria bacterium]|nr:transporter substrate-binding domain-containing protein [Alphaproteobacteria bacterium]
MKLNSVFVPFILASMFISLPVHAVSDIGVSNIQKRGTVYCGTNKNNHDLAYKDADGVWKGFDAAVCRAVAAALLGNKERFTMKPIRIEDAPKALHRGDIDFMIGEFSLPAETEISSNVLMADVLYFEKVMILAHKIEGAKSLEAYQDAKICMVRSSIDTYLMNNFIYKYKLNLKPLYYATRDQAIEGFFLNRCTLLTGASNELKTIVNTKFKGKDYVEVIPEVIGLRPVYVMVDKSTPNLGITLKWIINALRLIETYNINSENLPMMMGDSDPSIQNLLGNQPELWKKFKVHPQWMRKFIADEGNFREMYQRYLGPGTAIDLDELQEEHGLAQPKPFI